MAPPQQAPYYPGYNMYGPPMQMGVFPGGPALMQPSRRTPSTNTGKVCSFFNTEKGCAKGNSCTFLHESVRKKTRTCTFFTSGEGCKKGRACDFLHEGRPTVTAASSDESTTSERKESQTESEPDSSTRAESNTATGSLDSDRDSNQDVAAPKPTPEPALEQKGSICAYFNSKFGCKKGANCDFKHEKSEEPMKPPPQAPVAQVCDFWKTPQGCRKGSLCNFQHPGFTGIQNSRVGKETKVCAYFTSPRGCIKGASCDFVHVNPTSVFNATGATEMPPQVPYMQHPAMPMQNMQQYAMPMPDLNMGYGQQQQGMADPYGQTAPAAVPATDRPWQTPRFVQYIYS